MLEKINAFIWGAPTMFIVLFTGIFFCFKTRFVQLRFFSITSNTFGSLFKKRDRTCGKISQFEAFAASLAATMGTGNIVGVVGALSIGGAGAIFWMWVSAFFGMAIVYAENYFGIKYREKDGVKGSFAYILNGVKSQKLVVFYAFCCVLTSFGMGGAVQSNAAAESLKTLGFSKILSGICSAAIVGAVIIGGIKRIGKFASFLIPFLSLAYIGAVTAVIFINRENIASAFSSIFQGAFGIGEVGGGLSGYAISRAMNIGLRRGIFSNEAGLGTSALMHADVQSDDPKLQGQWGIVELFTDTFLCCTLTALAVLTSFGTDTLNLDVPTVVSQMFSDVFGIYSSIFVALCISLFALATMVSWAYCGESAARLLFGAKSQKKYRFVFICAVFIGAAAKISAVWAVSDIFNGLMLFPNIISLIFLSKYYSNST